MCRLCSCLCMVEPSLLGPQLSDNLNLCKESQLIINHRNKVLSPGNNTRILRQNYSILYEDFQSSSS
jgi:hypothetical protein